MNTNLWDLFLISCIGEWKGFFYPFSISNRYCRLDSSLIRRLKFELFWTMSLYLRVICLRKILDPLIIYLSETSAPTTVWVIVGFPFTIFFTTTLLWFMPKPLMRTGSDNSIWQSTPHTFILLPVYEPTRIVGSISSLVYAFFSLFQN